MKFSKILAGVALAVAASFTVAAPAEAAHTLKAVPGMTKADTKHAARAAYIREVGNDGCLVDFLESYRGVEKRTENSEYGEIVGRATTGKNKGKPYVMVLSKYKGGCQWQEKWNSRGYHVAPKAVQREFRGHGVVMWKVGDTTRIVARDGFRTTS